MMATEIAGKCFICKKEIKEHDLTHKEEGQKYPAALRMVIWPGEGILCTEHPGVIDDWEEAHGTNKKASRR
jgi:hypothetical protein